MQIMNTRAVRSRFQRLLTVGTVAGLAIAFAVTAGAASRSSDKVVATAGTAIPATAIPRLTAEAYKFAARAGDSSPESVKAVATTLAKAMQVTTPDESVPGSRYTAVYLVVMKGHFQAIGIPVPSGFTPPSGPDLELLFNAKTMQLLELGVGAGGPRTPTVTTEVLRRLGPISELARPAKR